MRSALLVAAGIAVCLSQPAPAYTISVQFSKPNSTYNGFLHDRNACLGVASRQQWWTSSGGYAMPGMPIYNLARFENCMLARGYGLDPNGFHPVKFDHLSGDNFRLVAM